MAMPSALEAPAAGRSSTIQSSSGIALSWLWVVQPVRAWSDFCDRRLDCGLRRAARLEQVLAEISARSQPGF
jgi:hypothetical protein